MDTSQSPIRVMIADHQQLFRHAVCALLDTQEDIEVVGDTADGEALLRLAADIEADVVCVGLSVQRMNGIETTRHLLARHPDLKVVGLSELTDWPHVRDMIKAGAQGYVSKSAPLEDLVGVIRTVAQTRRRGFCRQVTECVMEAAFDPAAGLAGSPSLTAREQEVLRMIAEGNSSNEIAESLKLSLATVRGYRSNIMRNLDLHNVNELTRFAISHGIAHSG